MAAGQADIAVSYEGLEEDRPRAYHAQYHQAGHVFSSNADSQGLSGHSLPHLPHDNISEPESLALIAGRASRSARSSLDDTPDSQSAGSFASWVHAPGSSTSSVVYTTGSPARRGTSGVLRPSGAPGFGMLPTVISEGNTPDGSSAGGDHEEEEPVMEAEDDVLANGHDPARPAVSTAYGAASSQYGGGYAPSSGTANRAGSRLQRVSTVSDPEAYAAGAADGDVDGGTTANGHGHGGEVGTGRDRTSAASGGSQQHHEEPGDLEDQLELLKRQRGQYRNWVSQCAEKALEALEPSLGSGQFAEEALPGDIPGMVAAMDVAGEGRYYLAVLKVAAEASREAGRAFAAFEALSLPHPEEFGTSEEVAAGETAEADYVSSAYAVTTAVATARSQVAQVEAHWKAKEEVLKKLPQLAGLDAALESRLSRVGGQLCRRLRAAAADLMARLAWPPPLAPGAAAGGSGGGGEGAIGAAGADGDEGMFDGFEQHPVLARRLVGVLTALTHHQMAVENRPAFWALLSGSGEDGDEGDGANAATGQDTEGAAASPSGGAGAGKPLLWAAQALAEPVAAKLRSHFHPAAPTGRLDRPAWLYGTVLSFVRQHAHALSSLDDMLGCLGLKPHYNMPAEFTRALQDAVLQLLQDTRIPAMLAAAAAAGISSDASSPRAPSAPGLPPPSDGDAAAVDGSTTTAAAASVTHVSDPEALWRDLMDASAAYDVALLPLLGATGPEVEAAAAKASSLLAAAARSTGTRIGGQRPVESLDPTSLPGVTPDMQHRFVAAATAAPAQQPQQQQEEGKGAAAGASGRGEAGEGMGSGAGRRSALLEAWAEAEGGTVLRAAEAVVYDDSSLVAAEEAVSRAMGAAALDEMAARRPGGGGGATAWQRDTWPSVVSAEAVTLLGRLVAQSRWLSAYPTAQRDFLDAAAGPLLALLRRRLGRVVEGAVATGAALTEEALPKVCAALCAAHHLDDYLHSLLLTELGPLVAALNALAPPPPTPDGGGSGAGTPVSATPGGAGGKLGGGGGGGLWGLLGRGGSTSSMGSPGRAALRDGVAAAVAAGRGGADGAESTVGGGAASGARCPVLGEYVRGFARLHRDGCLKLAREVALGFGRTSVAYRHAIEANPTFPFTPDDMDGEDPGAAAAGRQGEADGAPAGSITPSFTPALLFLQLTLARLSSCCDKSTFADVWRGAALSINRFMFNFIATESKFTRAGARQFASDVAGLAGLFAPYSRRAAVSAAAGAPADDSAAARPGRNRGRVGAGGQHFRELQAAARLLTMGDEEAADVMRRASVAAVAAQEKARAAREARGNPYGTPTKASASAPSLVDAVAPKPHARGDPVRSGMSADPVLSSGGLAVLSPLQIMNVIEHRL